MKWLFWIGAALLAAGDPSFAGEALWFSLSYSDLQALQLAQPELKEIWQDRIKANNALYQSRHDPRFSFGNAPVTEAHFFIESRAQGRLVLASILNSAEACSIIDQDSVSRSALKLCPTRLMLQDHGRRLLHDAGMACFVEYGVAGNVPAEQFRASAVFARYDLAQNALRLDARFLGRLKDQCAISIPLPAWP